MNSFVNYRVETLSVCSGKGFNAEGKILLFGFGFGAVVDRFSDPLLI